MGIRTHIAGRARRMRKNYAFKKPRIRYTFAGNRTLEYASSVGFTVEGDRFCRFVFGF